MHGLVSLLENHYYSKVEEIWKQLKSSFGLEGIFVTPYPHFSWQIAEDYNFNLLEEKMKEIAEETKPFALKTAGLGLFTGELPVFFISVVKDTKLMNFHKKIWTIFSQIGVNNSPHYNPESWVPHISLAYTDLNKSNIGKVMEVLAFESFHWEIVVDNIAFIFEPRGKIGELKYKFNFKG